MIDADARAAEVLAEVPRYVWDGARLPVPVEDIADTVFGLHVREVDDLTAVPGAPKGGHLSGLLVVRDKQVWVDRVEAQASPGRRRFTIGHEVGHWCLHAPTGDVFCRGELGLDGPLPAADAEAEASLFAGALLFPDALLRKEHRRRRGDLATLCDAFAASRIATERAVFRVVHRTAVLERSPDLVCFYWDDDDYDAYRAEYKEVGFVCNDHLVDPGGAKLHRLSCHYLNRKPREGASPRTRQPKWVSTDPAALRRAFPEATVCTSAGCEAAFRPPRRSRR